MSPMKIAGKEIKTWIRLVHGYGPGVLQWQGVAAAEFRHENAYLDMFRIIRSLRSVTHKHPR